MRPDIARAREPSGIVDSDLEGERYQHTFPRRGHQQATDPIGTHNPQNLPVQCGTMLKHGLAGLKQRVEGRFQQAIVANGLAHRRLECAMPVGQPDAFLAEQAADRVLEGDQLRLQGCARRQQPALALRPGDLTQTGRYLLTRIKSAMPRASLRSFLLRKPACSAAAARRASMQITGQPYRCSPVNDADVVYGGCSD